MKKQNLKLQSDATTDKLIIEKALYDILGEYDVHKRSGPHFIRASIIGDISIIIKMFNPFPSEGSSFALYCYISSIKEKKLLFSQVIQTNIQYPSKEDQLREAIRVISDIIIKMVVAYGYRVEHFSLSHNLDEKGMPSKIFHTIPIDESLSVDQKITFIIDTIINSLDIYTDCATVRLYYNINIGTEYEIKEIFSLNVQYSEVFYVDTYSFRYVLGNESGSRYGLTINDFIDFFRDFLYYFYSISRSIKEGEVADVVLYLMNDESSDHL